MEIMALKQMPLNVYLTHSAALIVLCINISTLLEVNLWEEHLLATMEPHPLHSGKSVS